MAGELVPLVLIPRFTTYAGKGTFTTVALDVSAFGLVHLATWAGPLLGDTTSGAALTAAVLQHSEDGDDWQVFAPMLSTPNSHMLSSAPLMRRYLRAKLQFVADANDVVALTCWSTGYLERRER
ncbi:MAG: hypothetical protein K8T90_18610 [Planctomycetes bacterium]|nr:hypothetical protein [Planctomycetota bacterium]